MERHYQKILRDSEDRVTKSLQIQVLDEKSPRYGGFADENGIVQAKFSIYRVATMTATYCNKDSVWYHDGQVLERVLSPIDGLLFTRREYPVVYEGALLARVLGGEKK